MVRRFSFALFVLFTGLAPAIFGAIVLSAIVTDSRKSTIGTPTPNPIQAPSSLFGPIELLVYVDPWFAGTISFWLIAGFSVLAVFASVGGMALVPYERRTSPTRSALFYVLGSLFLGILFALPWFYAIYQTLEM